MKFAPHVDVLCTDKPESVIQRNYRSALELVKKSLRMRVVIEGVPYFSIS